MKNIDTLQRGEQPCRELLSQLTLAERALNNVKQYLCAGGAAIDVARWGMELFRYVYTDISAAVYLGQDDRLISYILLDTDFGQDALRSTPPPGTTWIALVTNHPGIPAHKPALSDGDRQNLSALRQLPYPIKVFVVCDDACLQIA